MSNGSVIAVVLACALSAAPAPSQEKSSSPVEQRAAEVMALFRENSAGYEAYFSTSFLAQVPPATLASVFVQYFASCGRCLRMEHVADEGPYRAKYTFVFEKKMSVPVNIAVDAADPHLITGLLFGTPVPQIASLEEVVSEFRKLPGNSSFLAARLSGDGIEPVASYNPDNELAIGSAFKLYILCELVRAAGAGERHWADIVRLRQEALSLPSGFLHKWEVNSPLTLHTLAALMISQSDNTAADQLLRELGRENVERMLKIAGHAKPEVNIPFPSTAELFKLKGDPSLRAARTYLPLSTQERRTYLRDSVSRLGTDGLTFSGQPVLIDSLEWFASAADLCRMMNWLRINSGSEPASIARGILAINPGLTLLKERWIYAGYKGGSEPGVMNMTYLLQGGDGDWYSVAATWNNLRAPLDETKLPGLLSSAIGLLR
jgi:beta-lactamase class A